MPQWIILPPRSKLHLPGVYPMCSPRPTGRVNPLYAGCYFPHPFVQNDGSDFNHTGTVFCQLEEADPGGSVLQAKEVVLHKLFVAGRRRPQGSE